MKLIDLIADGRTDLIVDFLNQGTDPQTVKQNGHSLIKWAAYYGDVTAIKLLTRHGVPLSALGDNFDLNGAAFHGHWQLCQFLLDEGADPNQVLPENGESPLHSCLSKSNSRSTLYIVQLLLSHGADPNVTTVPRKESGAFMRDAWTHGETPLHRAAAFGSVEVINELLEAGADKSHKDANGDSPLSWASWHARPGRILALLAYGPHNIHPLHIDHIQSDHGYGFGAGMMSGLLGQVHLPPSEA